MEFHHGLDVLEQEGVCAGVCAGVCGGVRVGCAGVMDVCNMGFREKDSDAHKSSVLVPGAKVRAEDRKTTSDQN